MAFVMKDRARMTTATTGTGAITLGAAVANAAKGYFRTFAAAGVANGDTFNYVIEDGGAWEIGLGTYSASGTVMARSLLASSTGALLNLTGAAEVYITALGDYLAGKLDRSGGVMTGHITLVADPASAMQPATKQYVDNIVPAIVISGLTLSNSAIDIINDIDIAVGTTFDLASSGSMVLSTSITKRLDATWAAGSGNGGLDAGTIGNNTYHLYLIKNPTSGAVDALFSASANAPSMPAGYTLKRRIGSVIRVSSAILPFVQNGDRFDLVTAVSDYSGGATTAAALVALTVPEGISVGAIIGVVYGGSANGQRYRVSSPLTADLPASGVGGAILTVLGAGVTDISAAPFEVTTNTGRQIRIRGSGNISPINIQTNGWIDRRSA